jgi:hypothetical protein
MRRYEINLKDKHDGFILVQARIIAIHPISLYNIVKFDAPDKLQAAIFIVWRTT